MTLPWAFTVRAEPETRREVPRFSAFCFSFVLTLALTDAFLWNAEHEGDREEEKPPVSANNLHRSAGCLSL